MSCRHLSGAPRRHPRRHTNNLCVHTCTCSSCAIFQGGFLTEKTRLVSDPLHQEANSLGLSPWKFVCTMTFEYVCPNRFCFSGQWLKAYSDTVEHVSG